MTVDAASRGRLFFRRSFVSSLNPGALVLRAGVWAGTALLLAPLCGAVFYALFGESAGASLSAVALARIAADTVLFAGGAMFFALLFGLSAAWLTVMCKFPGRALLGWGLLLPFALPAYVTAYVYADFADAAGIVFRGPIAASFTLGLATCPYVFALTRAALRAQSCDIQSAARTMGRGPFSAFMHVSVPLSRPAATIGASLVAMEALNDLAIAEHYGVDALGRAVYDLWLNRQDLAAACRLALFAVALVAALLWAEERARRRERRFASSCEKCYECDRAQVLHGWRKWGAFSVAAFPVLAGFVFPVLWLAKLSLRAPGELWVRAAAEGLGGSAVLTLSAGGLTLALAVLFAMERRARRGGALPAVAAHASRVGYALPGAVLAQGFFVLALGAAAVAEDLRGFLFGGIGMLAAAGATRFFFVASGALNSGLDRISPQIDSASRLAGRGPWSTFFFAHLPMLRPALAAALTIVALEALRELPMTLILRPFNFETLATIIYQYASDESLELAAPAALLTAGVSAAAVLFLAKLDDIRRARRGLGAG